MRRSRMAVCSVFQRVEPEATGMSPNYLYSSILFTLIFFLLAASNADTSASHASNEVMQGMPFSRHALLILKPSVFAILPFLGVLNTSFMLPFFISDMMFGSPSAIFLRTCTLLPRNVAVVGVAYTV